MSYLKKVKSKKGRTYEYWVENTRVNGRVVQKYLGKAGESKVVKAYRENIGRGDPVGPILAEEIRKAESRYPQDWLLKAIRETALKTNRPSWSYVMRIAGRQRREDGPEGSPSKMELNEFADEVMYNMKREMGVCPNCGREANHFNLLLKSCPYCGHKLTGPELKALRVYRRDGD
jgi:hypothetical protein